MRDDEIRRALAWYAAPDSWRSGAAPKDKGALARAALQGEAMVGRFLAGGQAAEIAGVLGFVAFLHELRAAEMVRMAAVGFAAARAELDALRNQAVRG